MPNYDREWLLALGVPWPDGVERLGPRRVGPFAPCEGSCSRWSWVRYGDIVLCLPCVLAYNEPTAP
jgi:hypothetical protein